jgi:hypothetical protein
MKTTTILFASLLAAPLFAADPAAVTGTFAAGERYVEPTRDAPPSVSRMYVRAVQSATANSIELPATGGTGMIVLMLSIGGATHASTRAMLKTPSGDSFGATESSSADLGVQRFVVDAATELGLELHGGTQEVIHINRTEAASYRLALPETRDGGVIVVAGEPDSKLTLTTSAGPLSRHDGEPVTLRAIVRDGDEPVHHATVTARLGSPSGAGTGDVITLFDDGAHNDGAANDGEYAAVLRELPSDATGFWAVRYDADGATSDGVPFARSGASSFMNEAARARLQRDSVIATVADGVLHVRANADVLAAGAYRFDVIVASAADARGERNGVAWGEAVRTLTTGSRELTLDVPVGAIDTASLFLDVRLLSLDTMGVAGRVTIDRAAK